MVNFTILKRIKDYLIIPDTENFKALLFCRQKRRALKPIKKQWWAARFKRAIHHFYVLCLFLQVFSAKKERLREFMIKEFNQRPHKESRNQRPHPRQQPG